MLWGVSPDTWMGGNKCLIGVFMIRHLYNSCDRLGHVTGGNIMEKEELDIRRASGNTGQMKIKQKSKYLQSFKNQIALRDQKANKQN